MSFKMLPFLQRFWNDLRKIGINSLNVWWSSPLKLSVPVFFLCECGGELVITDSVSLLVYQVFYFSLIQFW